MTRRRRTLAIAAGIVAVAVTIVFWPRTMAARPAPDTVPAEGGAIVVSPIAHGTLQIEHGSQAILVDPTGRAGFDGVPWPLRLNYAGLRPPTIVLVTDDHRDHYDPELLRSLKTAAGAPPAIVAPEAVASEVDGAITLANFETKVVNGVQIDGVPMYNTVGQQMFHPKGHGNGYLVTLGGKRIYIAGDTACTPEMRALKDVEVAFLPMNLPYTMTPSDAAICAVAFKPKVAYAYHYRGQDTNRFATILAGTGIEVRLRDWYAGAPGIRN